jgi:DNA-binding transcriptional MerR regulator
MKPLFLSLPDELAEWRGTAIELADKCNELLASVPSLADDAGAANERLMRHYVQVGVLTPPEREGREALFGVRQVVEFLATRYLLKDGWSLAKAGELVRSTNEAELTHFIPTERPRTRAEEAVARYRMGVRDDAVMPMPAMAAPRPMATSTHVPPPMSRANPLERAAGISQRRVSLEENLKALGNDEGRPDRRRVVRITLAPWCQVEIDARELEAMGDETPGILGTALTQALQDERIKKGD